MFQQTSRETTIADPDDKAGMTFTSTLIHQDHFEGEINMTRIGPVRAAELLIGAARLCLAQMDQYPGTLAELPTLSKFLNVQTEQLLRAEARLGWIADQLDDLTSEPDQCPDCGKVH